MPSNTTTHEPEFDDLEDDDDDDDCSADSSTADASAFGLRNVANTPCSQSTSLKLAEISSVMVTKGIRLARSCCIRGLDFDEAIALDDT